MRDVVALQTGLFNTRMYDMFMLPYYTVGVPSSPGTDVTTQHSLVTDTTSFSLQAIPPPSSTDGLLEPLVHECLGQLAM